MDALDVVLRGESYVYKGGSLREGGLQIGSDDGKRWDALDVVLQGDSLSYIMLGEGFGEGVVKYRLGSEAGG